MFDLFWAQPPFTWKCPICQLSSVVSKDSKDTLRGTLSTTVRNERDVPRISICGVMISCQNPDCNTDFVAVGASEASPRNHNGMTHYYPNYEAPVGIGSYTFFPTVPRPLSSSVPQAAAADYNEAYLIRELSPKAAATLARRALQSMVRHRWALSPSLRTLAGELDAIRDLCDPQLYEAMMALKAIGNIGAHPEKNIDEIIEVEPGEMDELLNLLVILDEEWYVAREKRSQSIARITQLGVDKGKRSPPTAG